MNTLEAYADSLSNSHIILAFLLAAFFAQLLVRWAQRMGYFWQMTLILAMFIGLLAYMMLQAQP